MCRNIYKNMLAISLVAVLFGCGGGSGSSDTTSSVSGTVSASKLKGVKVCVKGSVNCATSDENGYFSIKGVSTPVDLEVKIGDTLLKSFKANSSSLDITPAFLADNNSTVAAYLGTILHKAGNCSLSQDKCDLSNVNSFSLASGGSGDFVSQLKQQLTTQATISFKVNNQNMNVTSSEKELYMNFNPSMSGIQKYSYAGAAGAGDFMKFTYDKSSATLSYSITGNVYGNQSKTKGLKELYADAFFTDATDQKDFYFLTGSLGVGVVPIAGQTNPAFLIGLHLPEGSINEDLIVNKEFNYIDFDATGDITFAIVDINKSSSGNRTWTAYTLGQNGWESESGTWTLDSDHINVLDANGDKIANLIIKPGVSRAGFIIDNVGGGFGIGVEAKALQESEIKGTFSFYDEDLTGEDDGCFGDVVLNGTSFTSTEKYCITSNGMKASSDGSQSGTLSLNPTVAGRKLNGLAKVNSDDANTAEYAFIDAVDGYFISVGFDTNTYSANFLSIGSNKNIK